MSSDFVGGAVGDLSERQLGKIALLALKYRYLDADETLGINFRRWSDYDGSPYEDFYRFQRIGSDREPLWSVTVKFESQSDGYLTFDYIAPVARSMSTAYKVRPDGAESSKKFKLSNTWVEVGTYDRELLRRELLELSCIYENLDRAENSLEYWSSSGFRVWVECSTARCYNSGRIVTLGNDVLRKYFDAGVSLDALRGKLTCKLCGSREPMLHPLPPTSNSNLSGD